MTGEHELVAAAHESAAARRLPDAEKRLVAALVQLEKDLPAIIEEILAGDMDEEDRRHLGMTFASIAADATPPVVEVLPPALWPDRIRNSGRPPHARLKP